MTRLLACWFDRLATWGLRWIQRRDHAEGTLWLRFAERAGTTGEPPSWARPLEALAREARQEGAAAVARLTERLPAGVSVLGEWQTDNGDTLRVLAAWRGWPEQPGRREISHWLWLARRFETGRHDRFAARRAARLAHANRVPTHQETPPWQSPTPC